MARQLPSQPAAYSVAFAEYGQGEWQNRHVGKLVSRVSHLNHLFLGAFEIKSDVT